MSKAPASTKPKTAHHRVAIIGGGPGGMCVGIKLLEAGYDDFVIIEKSGGVGGTWYNTRYPGLTCDVKSYLYSFSFEPNPNWSSHYAGQPEILDYMEHVATKYGLRPHLRLNSKVTAAKWDEAAATWAITTEDGARITCNVLIAAQGMFNELNWPEIDGMDSFGGTIFHASRWREDHDLTGRRVAVIGSAAAAVQFIPKIAPKTEKLFVYQRSPAWVAPKDDPVVSPAERAKLSSDPAALEALRKEIHDGLESVITFGDPALLEGATRAAIENIAAVNDPELRRKMQPDIPWGCLRPLISNDYYPTFNLPHVELVTDPIHHITQHGVVSNDGKLRRVDTIICATGYHVRKYLTALDVTGRDGLSINDAWKDGAVAYLGLMTSGFPNLFMMYGPNTNNGSILFMLERQADFIIERLRDLDRDHLAWMDIRKGVMDEYNAKLQKDLDAVVVWQANCSNYYRTESGRIVTQWPHTMAEYKKRVEARDMSRFETAKA